MTITIFTCAAEDALPPRTEAVEVAPPPLIAREWLSLIRMQRAASGERLPPGGCTPFPPRQT